MEAGRKILASLNPSKLHASIAIFYDDESLELKQRGQEVLDELAAIIRECAPTDTREPGDYVDEFPLVDGAYWAKHPAGQSKPDIVVVESGYVWGVGTSRKFERKYFDGYQFKGPIQGGTE